MSNLEKVFKNNQEWAKGMTEQNPDFFKNLAKGQEPDFLWLGCADSRVPASKVCGMEPGDIFVHRNIANLAVYGDLNFASVLQYSVEVLKVSDIIVCGHYGCGGVEAAYNRASLGIIDGWIKNIAHVHDDHKEELASIADKKARLERLVELNVIQQVNNVKATSTFQGAIKRGQDLSIHGLVYSLESGLLNKVI